MKHNIFRIALFLLAIVITTSIYAQENSNSSEYKTLLGDNIEHGGYGAFHVGYTKVGDYNAFTGGMKGAWLINHYIGLGLAGSGFMSGKVDSVFPSERDAYFVGGYGGFLIEPIFYANSPVHFSLPMIIGGGGVTYIRDSYFDMGGPYYPDYYATFFVFEPGVELELNMVKFMRVAIGVSYRMTSDVDLVAEIAGNEIELLGKKDMNKIVAKLIFKFGKF
jgi:hypothetical protein